MPAGLRLKAQVLQLWRTSYNRGLPIAITFSKACKNSFALMFSSITNSFALMFSSITLFCNVVSGKTVFCLWKYCFQKRFILFTYKENGHLRYCHNIKDRYKMIINCLPWHSVFRKFWSQVFRNFVRRRTNQCECLRYLKLCIFVSFIIFLSFVGLVIITY